MAKWNEPMAQFSWVKAFTYAGSFFLAAAVLQSTVILPGARQWLEEERKRRDQTRIIQEYQLENNKLGGTIQGLQRQVIDRDEVIRRHEIELQKLRRGPDASAKPK